MAARAGRPRSALADGRDRGHHERRVRPAHGLRREAPARADARPVARSCEGAVERRRRTQHRRANQPAQKKNRGRSARASDHQDDQKRRICLHRPSPGDKAAGVIKQAFARLGLAGRIGAAIFAAVAAIQVLVTLVFVLNPPNFHPFYSARWLSNAAVTIIKTTSSGEPELASALADLQDAETLAVRFVNAPPRRLGPGEPPWPLNRVLATVRSEVGDAAAPSVEAVGMGPSGEPIPVVPADAFAALQSGPLRPGEDLLLPPVFLIAVDLHDGRWLTIEPSRRAARRRLAQSLASIFLGTLLIAAIAVLTA